MSQRPSDIVFDWNEHGAHEPRTAPVELDDETLRDGIQSPSAIDPSIEDKLRLVHLMDGLGITTVNLGLPGAGKRAYDDVTRLAKEIADKKLRIQANCAARTVVGDVAPILDVRQRTGLDIEVYTFIGSSPIRQFAEEWDLEFILKQSQEAIRFAAREGARVAYVTEDTTRSRPEALEVLFSGAVEAGAGRLVLCDTVGHATPRGVRALVRWTRAFLERQGLGHVKIDFHGHNDRGLALANALMAVEAGADRVHGCAGGIGERVGNAAMDQILVNLKLLGLWPHPLRDLPEYVRTAARATGFEVPRNYPAVGRDAFRTATGVHAAAIVKAKKKGDTWLADRVYSGVPAGELGREQEIEIGHMSGLSNVNYWLAQRAIPADEALARAILAVAKSKDRTLTDEEVMNVVREHGDRRKMQAH